MIARAADAARMVQAVKQGALMRFMGREYSGWTSASDCRTLSYMTALALDSPAFVADSLAGVKVNARLGAGAAAQLEALRIKTGLGISEILRQSLAQYHASVMHANQPPPKSRLASLAGKHASSGPDAGSLSVNYKAVLAQGWADKHAPQARVPAKPKRK